MGRIFPIFRGRERREDSCPPPSCAHPPVSAHCSSVATTPREVPPVSAGAALPPQSTERGAENAHQNRSAQRIFDQIKNLTEADGRDPKHETVTYLDPATGQTRQRHFRVTEGKLEEYSVVGTKPDGSKELGWKVNEKMNLYYYAAGKLYRADGSLVGNMGINSEARNLAGAQFLSTHGTLQATDGKIWRYQNSTLTFNGAPAIIKMGAPPGTVQTFRASTGSILVDGKDRCGNDIFHQIRNDRASEVVYRKGGDMPTTVAMMRAVELVFEGKKKVFEVYHPGEAGADGKSEKFQVSRVEGNYAYFKSDDGLEQFRIERSSDATGSQRYALERKVHIPTNWEECSRVRVRNSCGGWTVREQRSLTTAKVGWMRDEHAEFEPSSPSDLPDPDEGVVVGPTLSPGSSVPVTPPPSGSTPSIPATPPPAGTVPAGSTLPVTPPPSRTSPTIPNTPPPQGTVPEIPSTPPPSGTTPGWRNNPIPTPATVPGENAPPPAGTTPPVEGTPSPARIVPPLPNTPAPSGTTPPITPPTTPEETPPPPVRERQTVPRTPGVFVSAPVRELDTTTGAGLRMPSLTVARSRHTDRVPSPAARETATPDIDSLIAQCRTELAALPAGSSKRFSLIGQLVQLRKLQEERGANTPR